VSVLNLNQRRAVEALRAGVPNRDVVRQLKPMQPELESRFAALLQQTQRNWADGTQAEGLLIEGGFGTGKSHCMEYLRHLALENNFVCSTLVLNKEMPLHNLARIYRGCVEAATVADKTGPALTEIVNSYHTNLTLHYRELYQWVHQPDKDPRIGATLFLFEDCKDENLREKIVAEWTGYPMRLQDLRAALKEVGQHKAYNVSRPQTLKVSQRFEFLSRFFRSAGYNGWVILLDETEIISRYSLQQRGKAYAHLAQLMGLTEGTVIPGLAGVFAITDDYAGQVLRAGKSDVCNVPEKLKGAKDDHAIGDAIAGMSAIETKSFQLGKPTASQVLETYDKVRLAYSEAYAWDAPPIDNKREHLESNSMRQYVRSWINTWDLRRLYDYQAQTTIEDIVMSYDEDTDLQEDAPEIEEGATI
jgi:hypothetical protein